MENLNASILAGIAVTLPPLAEQEAIVDHVDATTAEIDKLIARVECASELLREHRVSLIAAAVTGQIDVRAAVLAGAAP